MRFDEVATFGDAHLAQIGQTRAGCDVRRIAIPYRHIEPADLPPREWLFDQRLIRGFVSLTVSPGGIGKSSLVLVEAMAMASGRPLLGKASHKNLRVLIWNGEDPADETQRRVAAACKYFDIAGQDLEQNLFISSGRTMPINLAREERGQLIVGSDLIDALVAVIRAQRIDVVIIDPFVTTHSVNENDNRAVNSVVSAWREIADRANCAVELVHHSQKGALTNGRELGVSQSRGASALLDGVRSARFLVGMTSEEASKAGLDSPYGYFRVLDGKANLAPRCDRSRWYRMHGVDLENYSDEYPEGDSVGVCTPWKWPDAFADVSLDDLSLVKELIVGERLRYSDQADDWAGTAVALVLELDIGPRKKGERSSEQNRNRAKVRSILGTWISNGELKVVEGRDPMNRRITKFVEVPSA